MISEELQKQWIETARVSLDNPPHDPLFAVQIRTTFENLDISDENFWETEQAQQIVDALKTRLEMCSMELARTAVMALRKTYRKAQKQGSFEI